MPSHILIVTDAWFPQVNGVVTVFNKTKELLEQEGHKVTIVHPEMFLNVPLPFYPEIRLAIASVRNVEKHMLHHRPDYIHIATEGPLGIVAKRVCKKNNIAFTTSYHTHFPLYIKVRINILHDAAYAFLRWFHKDASLTMVSTESLKKELEDRGFANVVVWPFGVDTELFKKNRALSSPYEKPVFIYFGRIAVEKNVEEFLQTALPGTKVIVGNGPDRKKLEERYGNEKTIFLGYKKGQDLTDAISLADVFVFPSKTETFGLVVIESLACEVPVAAHDVMGPRDIISHGIDGYLSEDLEEAAKKCLSLSKHKCREKALLYNWWNSAHTFLSFLRK